MDKAIDEVLDMFDTNKDGMIDRSELNAIFEAAEKQHNIKIPKARREEFIRAIDPNGDGVVTRDELVQLYKAVQAAEDDGDEYEYEDE